MTIIDSTVAAQVSDRAHTARPGRALLTLLALVPFLLGWLAGATVTASTWIWAAVIVGWQTGRQQEGGGPPADGEW
jgi:hypothetical protein